jgi:BlaI family transcriptional regulator, penicillinase repressor
MEIVLYDRELDVMQVLWEKGPSTVAEVREALTDDMAYTTVLTYLRRMEEKGYVSHEEDGRAHRYQPLIEREHIRESALQRLTRRLFDGSTEMVLSYLVSDRKLSEADLRRLRDLVDRRLPEEDR